MSVKTKGNTSYNGKAYNLWQRERAISHQAHINNGTAYKSDATTLVQPSGVITINNLTGMTNNDTLILGDTETSSGALTGTLKTDGTTPTDAIISDDTGAPADVDALGAIIHAWLDRTANKTSHGYTVGAYDATAKTITITSNVYGTADNGVTFTGDMVSDGYVTPTAMSGGSDSLTLVLTSEDSGRTIYIDDTVVTSDGTVDISLPVATSGLNYRFVLSSDATTGDIHINANGSEKMAGVLMINPDGSDDDAVDVAVASHGQVGFDSTAKMGDWIEVISDGTYWYVTGHSNAAAGLTVAA